MSDRDKEAIACDLHEIVSQVLCVDPPPGLPKEREGQWRFTWLTACLWGYCQTDLGVWHGSGEDCSSWREDATGVGIDLSLVTGRTYGERARDEEQRRLYAEAMAPGLVDRMLASMREAV